MQNPCPNLSVYFYGESISLVIEMTLIAFNKTNGFSLINLTEVFTFKCTL